MGGLGAGCILRAMEPRDATIPIPPPSTAALPAPGDFLRQVFDLGRRTFGPAAPALVLLYCYRFGMGLYMALSGAATTPLGFPDYQAKIVAVVVILAAYLPIMVLLWTPLLPLQDGLLSGPRRSFLESVKRVLELLWPYGLSSIVQTIIVVVPAALIMGGFVLLALPAPEAARAALIVLAFVPVFVWILISVFFVSFATPLLILDGRGPVASVRESVSLVRRRFGGLLGRVFLFLVVLTFASLFAKLPSSMLQMVSAVSGHKWIGVEVARAFWDSAVETGMYPFTIASLLILYRAMVPASGGVAEAATPAAPVVEGEAAPAANPYRFE